MRHSKLKVLQLIGFVGLSTSCGLPGSPQVGGIGATDWGYACVDVDLTTPQKGRAGSCAGAAGRSGPNSQSIPVVLESPPSLTAVDPPIAQAGLPVMLHLQGSHFAAGSQVELGGQPATRITVSQDGNEIWAEFSAQPQSKSWTPIRITNPDTQSITKPKLFSFYVNSDPAFFGAPGVGGEPGSIALADFNQDGILDIVTADISDPALIVSYLLPNNIGPGGPDRLKGVKITNVTNQNANLSDHPEFIDIAAADFNGDTIPDIVLAEGGSGYIRFMYNDGTGRFPTSDRILLGSNISAVTVADINSDSYSDILALDMSQNRVAVLIGTGSGIGPKQFAPVRYFAVGNMPVSMTRGDLNADGIPDLLVANLNSTYLSILFADTNGHFSSEAQLVGCPEARSPVITKLDQNAASLPDIAVSCPRDSAILLLRGVAPTATTSQSRVQISLPVAPYGITVADFDADHNNDIAVGTLAGGEIFLLHNQRLSPGHFDTPRAIRAGFIEWATMPFLVTTADINNDNLPDIITLNRKWGGIGLVLSQP